MMEKVGVKSLDDLYAEVPDEIRFRGDYQLPEQMSEVEVRQLFEKLGGQNEQLTCFGGAGVYDHYTPAVIPALLSRSEFLTSYTPYQAEISQGTLHYIFEYQSMMAEPDGNGHLQRLHVRRDDSRCRGGDDGCRCRQEAGHGTHQ